MVATIIVPLDGSPVAEHALPWATSLSECCKAPISLLRVIAPDSPDVVVSEARTALEQLAARLPDARVDVRFGNPSLEIVAAAEELPEPVVVMTSFGMGGASRWRFGSVADRVVQASPAPVLVIRVGVEDLRQPPIRSIVVPLDRSAHAESALPFAMQLARAMAAEIALVHVIDTPAIHELVAGGSYGSVGLGPFADIYADLVGEARLIATDYLNSVAERVHATGIPVRTEVLEGKPAEEIMLYESRWEPGLVAIATRGHGDASWLVVGSIADRIVKLGSSPVLIVRPEGQPPIGEEAATGTERVNA